MQIAKQARNERGRKLFEIFREGLVDLDRRCQGLMQEVQLVSERQEVLVGMVVGKRDMQKEAPEKYQDKIFEEFKGLEEQRATEALALFQINWDKARIMQRLEASTARGPRSVGHDNSSFGSCSSSLALHTDEAMSASSRMVQEVDEVTSESYWTALAKGKERYWWSIELEGEVEKLEVRSVVQDQR